ncbi:chemotaxis protein [Marinobacter salinus]|uniref:Chemotaxis protein n=1 Tax=Marinobacter salinus TaxID=1874317 RepID=A0A1D9GQ91_9GAMM|nr:PAS domain-containing methyl-accepting chemotaxis protein [Marinobacter salinus]AOY89798.1 chemotaxis protein [Marinobacter salinus]
MRRNEPVTRKEQTYPEHYHLITTTDIKGRITAANEEFAEVAGFEVDELVGQPHNLIRHPDMPPGAFENMWQTIKAGESWRGIVKNRCKNGDHYWVDAFVTPIRKDGQIVEFQSLRTRPSRDQIERAEKVYSAWNRGQVPRRYLATSPSLTWKLSCLYGLLAASLTIFGLSELTVPHMIVMQGLVFAVFATLFWLTRPMMKSAREACCEAHPALPWIYTGRRDEGAWIEFDRQKRDATLRAVSARMHANIGSLHGRKQRTVEWVSNSVTSIRSQQDDIQHITRAFEELAQSVQRVSELTTRTHDATRNAGESGSQCRQQMNTMNTSLSGLQEQLSTANKRMGILSEKSDAIGVVLEVISDIAEQTNLLALNAAIEAARAGESGRGFAVVADEVRGLAKRTHESTRKIDEMIDALQKETHGVVSVINEGVTSCETTATMAVHASEALEATMKDVDVIASCAHEVAGATEEQSALSTQVERQAERLMELGNQSVQSSESAREESEHLGNNVDQAQLLTSHFLQMLIDKLIPGHPSRKDTRARFPGPVQ